MGSKHYSELRAKSWQSGSVRKRKLVFSRAASTMIPTYTVALKSGAAIGTVYEDELRRAPKL